MVTILKAYRLPKDLMGRLAALAKETNRSEKFFVEEAIRQYLSEHADSQIAKERFNDPKSKVIPSLEMKARLGL